MLDNEITKQRVVVTKIVEDGEYGREISYLVIEDLQGNRPQEINDQFTSLGYFDNDVREGDELTLTRDPSLPRGKMWYCGFLSANATIMSLTHDNKGYRGKIITNKIRLKQEWRTRLAELRNK